MIEQSTRQKVFLRFQEHRSGLLEARWHLLPEQSHRSLFKCPPSSLPINSIYEGALGSIRGPALEAVITLLSLV